MQAEQAAQPETQAQPVEAQEREERREERHAAVQAREPGRVSRFFSNMMRVLRVAKKPDREEFVFVAKVTGLGILIVGLLGYIVESIRWILTGA